MTDSQPSSSLGLAELAKLTPPDAISALQTATGVEAGLVAAAAEAERLIMSDLQRGIALIPGMITVADHAKISLPRVRFRRVWAQALCYANRMEEALVALTEASQIAETAGDTLEGARVKTTSLGALARLGRYAEAIAAGEAACAAFEKHGELEMYGRTNNNLGVVRRMSDDPAGALIHFDRAKRYVAGNPMLSAQLNSNRAEAFLDSGRLADAERAFADAFAAFNDAKMANGAAIVQGNLADLAARQGRPHSALDRFERAIGSLDASAAKGDVARLEAEQAEVLAMIGLHAAAERALRRAVPTLAETGLVWEHARALASLGKAETAVGRAEDAHATLLAAQQAFEKLGHTTGAARAAINRAESLLLAGDAAAALSTAHAAADAVRGRPLDRALAALASGLAALKLGDLSGAEAELTTAAQTAVTLDIAPLLASSLHARGRVHRAANRVDLAAQDFADAVTAAERVRGTLQADRFRSAVLGENARLYEDCAAAMLDRNAPTAAAEALEIVEQAKARSTLELMSTPIADEGFCPADTDERRADDSLLQAVQCKREELNAAYATLDDGFAKPRAAAASVTWAQRVADAERALEDVENRLATSGRFAGAFAAPASLNEVQDVLPDDTLLLEYFSEPSADASQLSAFAISRHSTRVHRNLCDNGSLADAAGAWRFQLSRALARGPAGCTPRLLQSANESLESLGHLLLARVAGEISGFRRIIIVPHGQIWSLPMAALRLDDHPLLERASVTLMPSATIAARLLARPESTSRTAVTFGVSDEQAPRTEQEATAVAAMIAGSICKIGRDATRAAFRALAPTAGLIHVAAHARFVAATPQASGLRLADAWLTAADVLRLKLDAPTVVLSACDSGKSGIDAANDLLGLIRAFLVAGATSVVSSLWPLHDETALKMMVETIGLGYAEGGSSGIQSRLRRSQLEQARSGLHPAFWAPMFSVGTP
jgi:tetratricopeptide (TPR) repeat protein